MFKSIGLLLLLFVLYELKSAQCHYETLPEIKIIPTGVVPHICVSVNRDLPPCIGKFKEHQRKYKHQINKILQSYADMIIDYKDSKNASFENYGPGKIYLQSFESLNRELEEEEARKKLSKKGNSSNIQDDAVVNMPEEFDNQTEEETMKDLNADEPSIIQITRVVRSLEMTVLVADQCIPLGIEFCDFTKPVVEDKKTEDRIRKRSIQSFNNFFKTFTPHRINYSSKNYSKLRKNFKRKQLLNKVNKTSFSHHINDDKYRKQKIMNLFNKLKKRK